VLCATCQNWLFAFFSVRLNKSLNQRMFLNLSLQKSHVQQMKIVHPVQGMICHSERGSFEENRSRTVGSRHLDTVTNRTTGSLDYSTCN